MLSKILAEFDRGSGAVCSDEIARRLGVEPALLSDMYDMLIGMGRLVEVHTQDECGACTAHALCGRQPHARRSFHRLQEHKTP